MGTQSPGTIRKTKRQLSGALMRLLEKHSFRKISVGDICQEAMVSRSAFYGHFSDKYELLRFTLEDVIRLHDEQNKGKTPEGKMISMLEGIQQNRRTVYHMFLADLSQEMMDIFTGVFEGAIRERLIRKQESGAALSGPLDLLTAFYAGGMANVLMMWIRENFATPKEEIARCQCSLLINMIEEADAAWQTEEEKKQDHEHGERRE